MRNIIKHLHKNYFEVAAFSIGLILLAFMDPNTTTGPGLCLLENLGFQYCPGDGLGHSISFFFRGEFSNALQSNILGPFAVFIIGGRIIYIVYKNSLNHNKIL
ncbi:DUF2752 domain-containing protein [Fodinibius sp. Rm-B-1B1-1]|uniref:DUF2752 domain-containing protein n=1 Tax=Fodinibius alkaliphilus TaxID=3140241 RepID=UPI00315A871C